MNDNDAAFLKPLARLFTELHLMEDELQELAIAFCLTKLLDFADAKVNAESTEGMTRQ